MRKTLALLAAGLLVLGFSSQAYAGTAGFGGTLSLSLGTLPSIPVKGAGVATTNGMMGGSHITTITLPGGVVAGSGQVDVTDPASVQIKAVEFTGTLEAGSLAKPGGALGLSGGLARLCLLDTSCALNVPIALTRSGSTGLGVGGQTTVGGGGALRISLDHAPWTIGTGTAVDQPDNTAVGNVTSGGAPCAPGPGCDFVISSKAGFAHGNASATSTTAFTSGVLQFVSPGQVTTNITSTSSTKIANINELVIHMVPEPGLMLLLGTGVAGMVVLGRRRMR